MLAFVASVTRSPPSQNPSRSGIRSSVSAASSPRRAFERDQLEERVERQELDPGLLVDLARRYAGEGRVHRLRSAPVAVMEWACEQRPGPVEQAEVAAPGVDADASHRASRCADLAQGRAELGIEAERVPVEAVGQPDGPVLEPPRLLDLDAAAVEAPDDRTTALGTEIECDLNRVAHRSTRPEFLTRCRNARRKAVNAKDRIDELGHSGPPRRSVCSETSIVAFDRL